MALYRCAACGSPNVVTDTQTGGIKYNYLKGALGTVALGAGGAAAGITSETQQVFKCPDCGVTLTYAMPQDLKAVIDLGVMSADARDKLQYCGVPVTWDFLIKKYKGIESGFGDKYKSEKQTILDQLNYDRSLEAQKGRDALKSVIEQESISNLAYFESWAKNAIEHDKAMFEQDRAEYEANLKKLNDEKAALENELPTLGIFKGGRKKEIATRIESIQEQLKRMEVFRKGRDETLYLDWIKEEKMEGFPQKLVSKTELSFEEVGKRANYLFSWLTLHGPSTMSEFNKMNDYKYSSITKIAQRMSKDRLLAQIQITKERKTYYAVPENYEIYIPDDPNRLMGNKIIV